MKYRKIVLITFIVISLLLFGCANETPEEAPGEDTEEDAESTASIVDGEAAFREAIRESGTWIIITTSDLNFRRDLVVEGEFWDNDDESRELYRKIALYAQDEDRNVSERYTVTAPLMYIKSPNTNIQGGTFEGDLYIEADGFTITDATIDGNVYFANEEYQSTFDLNDDGEITGDIEIEENIGDVMETAGG